MKSWRMKQPAASALCHLKLGVPISSKHSTVNSQNQMKHSVNPAAFFMLAWLVLAAGCPASAWAYLFAYPEKGQTPEQQTIDDQTCQKKARGKTKFDPAVLLSPAGSSINAMIKQRKAEHERGEKLKKFQMVYADCMKSRGYAVPAPK